MTIDTKAVALADGEQVLITGFTPDLFHPGPSTLSFQFENATGSLLGAPVTFEQDQPSNAVALGVGFEPLANRFDAVALTGGGFEVVYAEQSDSLPESERLGLMSATFDANGQRVTPFGFSADLNDANPTSSDITPNPPLLAELPGDRFAVAFETFDAQGAPTAHVELATALGGAYSDVTVGSRPDAITHDAGDITLTWNNTGVAQREILGLNGQVLADRAVSQVFSLGVAGNTNLEAAGFDPAHDQIRLINADGSVAGGTASTLTYDEHSHTLTWNPDSQGPAPATEIAAFVDPKAASPDGQPFDVANLADGFRPAVLKVIAADGSQDITWFDTTNAQPWDTLHATEDAQGNVLTYGSTLDDGTQQVFTFDVGNHQPWTRYVDKIDVSGHVAERTVLYDDNTSWTAKYAYSGGQVVSYELDSFDAQGRQVGQSFFNADGAPLGH